MNKRYHLFCYEQYYPEGGLNDYVGSYNSYEDAMKEYNREVTKGNIVTQEDGTVICETYKYTAHSGQDRQVVVFNEETGCLEEVEK